MLDLRSQYIISPRKLTKLERNVKIIKTVIKTANNDNLESYNDKAIQFDGINTIMTVMTNDFVNRNGDLFLSQDVDLYNVTKLKPLLMPQPIWENQQREFSVRMNGYVEMIMTKRQNEEIENGTEGVYSMMEHDEFYKPIKGLIYKFRFGEMRIGQIMDKFTMMSRNLIPYNHMH